jgi:protein TonB
MRNDLYIGALVAVGAHAALALISNPARPVVMPPEPPPTIEVRPFPRIPDEPEPLPATVDDAPKGRPDVAAPPSQVDVPKPTAEGDFTQRPQPVLEGVRIDSSIASIPTERPGSVNGGPGGVFTLRDLDRTPMARFQARPDYPFDMKRQGIAGEVLVEFIVVEDGSVRDARAVRSSQREFEDAAVRAVSKWTFRPGQKDGRNVPTRMQVPIVFSLNDERG